MPFRPAMTALVAAILCASSALSAPAGAQAPDPVVARVGGEEIRLSDIAEAAQGLPEELRGVPQQVLFPMLLDQLVDRKVISITARNQGLDKDPQVQRQVARATDQALQTALLQRDLGPSLSPDALRARYDREVAGKPGEEEIRARHILVADEAKAKQLIQQLKGGADFSTLARQNSTDPSAQAGGGDLGFFKRGDMLPEFSQAAFGLKPGDITETPVRTRFGWHVIKLEERRTAPAATFEQSRDELRQEAIQEGVRKVLEQAKATIPVERLNLDGTAPRATDMAEPPPAAAAPRPAR